MVDGKEGGVGVGDTVSGEIVRYGPVARGGEPSKSQRNKKDG
jgi:hypothetical protein